jgi:hypothetical protein
MNEEKPKEAAAPSTGVASNGKESAIHESIPGYKTISTWKRIGQLDRFQHGVRITYTDLFGTYHLLYISRNDFHKIIHDRMPGDLVSVDETTDRVVLNIEGRAFRSRSGRALCLRVPGLAGQDAMVPWNSFLAVIERKRKMAVVSILETC